MTQRGTNSGEYRAGPRPEQHGNHVTLTDQIGTDAPATRPERRRGNDGLWMLTAADQFAGSGSWFLVQLEHEAKGFVDRVEFVVTESAHELAESLVCDGRCLFNEDLGVVTVDGDRRAKDPRRRRTRRGSDEHGGQHQIVGLEKNGVSSALLLVTPR